MANRSMKRLMVAAAGVGLMTAAPALALEIELVDVNGTVKGTQAQLGFGVAAKFWETVLTDNVKVKFEVDFSKLEPGVLGGTLPTLANFFPIDLYYAGLAGDATSTVDVKAFTSLPTLSSTGSVSVVVPDYLDPVGQLGASSDPSKTRIAPEGMEISNTIALSLANVKAVYGDAGLEGFRDAYITFSSDFAFDFDPTDGIKAGTYDFVAVAIHEMGHALGFLSGADDFNYFAASEALETVDDYWWGYAADMFRYTDDGKLDWTFGSDAYFSLDGGLTTYNGGFFSTGEDFGDGWQASHWKGPTNAAGNFVCAPLLGIMNPYVCDGEGDNVTSLDLALFDAIGWDVAYDVDGNPDVAFSTANIYASLISSVPEPAIWAQMIAGFGLLGGALRRRARPARQQPALA